MVPPLADELGELVVDGCPPALLGCVVVVGEFDGLEGFDVGAGVPNCADDPRDVVDVDGFGDELGVGAGVDGAVDDADDDAGDGAGDDAGVGAGDDAGVGAFDAVWAPPSDGIGVGRIVAAVVEEDDVDGVGDGVGNGVGSGVGDNVGGRGVGATVAPGGAGVGSGVGDGVGARVGIGVGGM